MAIKKIDPSFEVVKRNFTKGLWTAETVAKAVKVGKITAAQYTEITGQSYQG